MPELKCELCVIGGGSGGIGAALAASKNEVDTILVEKEPMLGGTSTVCGVNCWEPIAGATGIPYDIYRELALIPDAVGIYSKGRHKCHPHRNDPPFPGGEQVIDKTRDYSDTLLRSGTKGLIEDEERCRKQWHGVIFESEIFDLTVQKMLKVTGNCRLRLSSSLAEVKMKNANEIDYVILNDNTIVRADLWIDNSSVLAQMAGVRFLTGEDPKSLFNEPDAPENASLNLNGCSLIFRITPRNEPLIEPLPEGVTAECWWAYRFPSMVCVEYPNGDRNCNMLPTISGEDYLRLGETKAYDECLRRVKAFWHHVQTEYPEFRRYQIKNISKKIGVRERSRVIAEYMLNENDLLQGIDRQLHSDIIAISDHMMDRHGPGNRNTGELSQPYGIPYRCLIPCGFKNLLAVGCFAGFSAIAASSCRLSRTMMQLGQAAGTAAALAVSAKDFTKISVTALQQKLVDDNVKLTFHPESRLSQTDVVEEVYRVENKYFYCDLDGIHKQDIVFGNVAGRDLIGYLYLPPNEKGRPFPSVVYLHGGGWHKGHGKQFERHAAAMARQGFAGLCVEYRLSDESKYPAAIQDSKCAVRYLRANAAKFNLDPAHIGAAGGSAGAHLSACLAVTGKKLKPEWEGDGGYSELDSSIQAAVLFNGEFDLTKWWEYGKGNEFMRLFFNKTYEEAPSLYHEASPSSYLKFGMCPCLIMHGEQDEVVPVSQAIGFHNLIQSFGGRSELITVPKAGHAWFNNSPHFEPCLQLMMDFFTKQLKKTEKASL